MKLSSNIYYGFDVLFYSIMGLSGFFYPLQVLSLFNLPPSTYRHDEILQFITSLSTLYANLLGVINLAQAFSFILVLRGNDDTKRIISIVNAFLNVALSSCFWYNIHYAHNPKDDITEHLLFTESGIASIWFSNMWGVADAFFLLYFGVYNKLPAQVEVATKSKKN